MAIKSKEVLQGLSKDKLKQYIFFLTRKYYTAYLNNDIETYDFAIKQLYYIIEEYDDTFVNLNGFMCYCLYLNANVELMKMQEQQDFKLEPLFKMDLLVDDVEELNHDLKNIFNKERIRERYNEKKTS